MLTANRHGRGPKPANRAARHPEVDHRVVFQHAAGDGRSEIRRNRRDLVPDNEACHVQRMNAAIGKLSGNAGHIGVIAPPDPRIIRIGGVPVMPMTEIRHDEPDLADLSASDHRPHLPNHRIGRVTVVNGADLARRLCHADDLFALLDRHGHRLFAEHVEPGLQKRLRDFEMRGIWRRDRNEVHAVIPARLALEHVLPSGIGAVLGHAKAHGIVPPPVRIGIQCTGGQREISIRKGTEPVRRSNLAAFTAANHSPVELHGLTLSESDAFQIRPVRPCVIDR